MDHVMLVAAAGITVTEYKLGPRSEPGAHFNDVNKKRATTTSYSMLRTATRLLHRVGRTNRTIPRSCAKTKKISFWYVSLASMTTGVLPALISDQDLLIGKLLNHSGR